MDGNLLATEQINSYDHISYFREFFPTAGSFLVVAEVFDSEGAQDSYEWLVSVTAPDP